MLHTPSHRRGSSLPTVLIVLACGATACYFAFFRGRAPATPDPVAAPPAVSRTTAQA